MRLRNWTLQISITTALLATWATQANAQSPGADKIAARVNGENITIAELQAVLDARPSPVPISKDLQHEMRKAAIDMLVDDLLMRQFLRKAVPAVDPAEVQKEYDKLKDALAKQKPAKTMEQFLQEGKMTANMLRGDIIARMQWKAYLTNRYTEAEIKSYYQANKIFFDNVVVHAEHILVKLAPNASAEEKQKAKAKLETIRQEIAAGKITFEDAARKYSDCPSKKDGGDIGHFPYKFVVVEPFAQAAFAAKEGAITDIVTTEFGYHIIKVLERSQGEPSLFEQSKDVIRDVMANENDLYQTILSGQKKNAKIEILAQ
jgi:parvulin-like peptidyl-prolyl isomerase